MQPYSELTLKEFVEITDKLIEKIGDMDVVPTKEQLNNMTGSSEGETYIQYHLENGHRLMNKHVGVSKALVILLAGHMPTAQVAGFIPIVSLMDACKLSVSILMQEEANERLGNATT